MNQIGAIDVDEIAPVGMVMVAVTTALLKDRFTSEETRLRLLGPTNSLIGIINIILVGAVEASA
jgi:hypothetical protein